MCVCLFFSAFGVQLLSSLEPEASFSRVEIKTYKIYITKQKKQSEITLWKKEGRLLNQSGDTCFVLGLWQTKCLLLYFLLKNEPLQRLPAAKSVLKRVMSASKNALNVGSRKLLEILGASQVINNTDDVNHSELTNLLFKSLVENVNECEYFDIPMRSSSFFQNQNSLSVFHVNIRSLTKNFDTLYELILSLPVSPDVVCVSETRIKSDPLINILIPNYNFFHKNSPTNAGGVAIYVSKKHQFKVMQEFKLNLKGCEELWIKLISDK